MHKTPFTLINKVCTSLHWSYEICICAIVLLWGLSHWILSNSANKKKVWVHFIYIDKQSVAFTTLIFTKRLTTQWNNVGVCTEFQQNLSQNMENTCTNFLWIKPTDALNSSFIGITTLHVSGSLSAHHQEFLAVHRLWYILCSCYAAVPSYSW